MRIGVFIVMCVSMYSIAQAKDYYELVVADPYIELHTGPGRGYPVFFVVDRGEQIQVLKQRTDWYKLRSADGTEGWASAQAMQGTVQLDGQPAKIINPDRDDYLQRRWELGFELGDFDGANAVSSYLAFMFTPNLSAELSGTHLTGRFSNGWMVNANIVHQPFPEWRISPFFTLGTGVLNIDPKATLVAAKDRRDQTANAGLGLRTHISKRFLLRAEYKAYKVFTSRDDNEEVGEWKAGFSFFF